MLNKTILIGLLVASTSMVGAAFADEGKDQAAVAKLLPSAKVTLSQGLAAAESKGRPISGKFEMDAQTAPCGRDGDSGKGDAIQIGVRVLGMKPTISSGLIRVVAIAATHFCTLPRAARMTGFSS